MPESRWDQSRQTVKSNLILAHLSLVFSAVLYFATVFIWVCLGWLLYDGEYASYISRNRVIDSKLATVLALSIVVAYPIYFWYHLKTNVAKIYYSLKTGSDSYLSVRLGLWNKPGRTRSETNGRAECDPDGQLVGGRPGAALQHAEMSGHGRVDFLERVRKETPQMPHMPDSVRRYHGLARLRLRASRMSRRHPKLYEGWHNHLSYVQERIFPATDTVVHLRFIGCKHL